MKAVVYIRVNVIQPAPEAVSIMFDYFQNLSDKDLLACLFTDIPLLALLAAEKSIKRGIIIFN